MMKATLIGTGTAFSRRYGNTNTLVEKGDVALMIDLGFTTPGRLENLDRNLREITHIAISHIHADHVGGLEELAFLSRFVFGIRPILLLPRDLTPDLWEHALKGGMELVSTDEGEPLYCTLETYFDVVILDNDWQEVGDLKIKAFDNDHVPDKASHGFIVRDSESGDQMIFGGDVRRRIKELETEPIDADFARGPIFHDCQLYDDGASGVHIPFPKLLEYPKSVRDRMILVHYNDSILRHLSEIHEAGFELGWPSDVITMPNWRECIEMNRKAAKHDD